MGEGLAVGPAGGEGFGLLLGKGSTESGEVVFGGTGAGAAASGKKESACRFSMSMPRSRGRASAVFVHAGDEMNATRATTARGW